MFGLLSQGIHANTYLQMTHPYMAHLSHPENFEVLETLLDRYGCNYASLRVPLMTGALNFGPTIGNRRAKALATLVVPQVDGSHLQYQPRYAKSALRDPVGGQVRYGGIHAAVRSYHRHRGARKYSA